MLLAVSKLRIGSGVSMICSAAAFLAGALALACLARERMSQIESPSSPVLLLPARADVAKAEARPNAAAEVRSLRRFRSIKSPGSEKPERLRNYHPSRCSE